ncbi:MAG TPA: sulfatase-like hydrolase/transferase [Phycisphaerae bacterium]|nr:sulfatase-like hydrolase/transferase [Phycisphaerae bacterium]
MRSVFQISLYVVFVVTTGGASLAAPPNVIVFYTDDMGSGDLSCYGATDIATPNIDALAASGMRFTSYYAPAPLCSPSRAAMLTGRYPTRAGHPSTKNIASGLNQPGLPSREITIAELVRTRGYATAVFGKWHLGSTPECQPNSQGFDLFVGHHASCVDPVSHWYYATEPYYHDLYRNRDEIFEDGVHMTDLVTRETLAFIDQHREKPFFIYVAYNTPHYPMVAHGRYMKKYAHLPRARQLVAALVAGIDDSVGQIMTRLRERDLLDRTLVFFASDNGAPNASMRGEGGGSNAPYREYKRSLFEGGIRVPGMVSWPGVVPAGAVCDQPVIGMDIFATVADATGAELPKDRIIDGRSWLPLFKDPTRPIHEALFFEWQGQHAVRAGRWKLVENGLIDMHLSRTNRATGEDVVFLADVTADPGEGRNLRAVHAVRAEELRRLHAEWRNGIASDPTASEDAISSTP